MLERAEVGETPADDGVVEPGMKVTVKLVRPRRREFLFGAREMAGDDIEWSSRRSPRWARRSTAPSSGETVDLRGCPTARTSKAEIVEAVPYVGLSHSLDDVVAVLPQPA